MARLSFLIAIFEAFGPSGINSHRYLCGDQVGYDEGCITHYLGKAQMKLLQRITMAKLVAGWMLLLIVAAVSLPPLDSRATANVGPVLGPFLLGFGAVLLAITPVVLFRHFKNQWKAALDAPNRTAYVAWISLQTLAAMICVCLTLYAVITH